MKSKQPWLEIERIQSLVHIEPALLIVALAILSFAFYKLLLRKVTPDRHRNLRAYLKNLFGHTLIFSCLYIVYFLFDLTSSESSVQVHVLPYIGLILVIWGAICFIKAARLLIFEYLFLSHMEAGVPVLIVNLSTLVISMVIGFWLLNAMFGVQLTPLIATSAVFSLIFGLALQDTLGNLFSGIAVQMDKPYEIGHWIEVQTAGFKWVGQVYEITWRATVLIGWYEEVIAIPNRIIAQAQISNFTMTGKPIVRGHSFKFDSTVDTERVRNLLTEAIQNVEGIKSYPEPIALVRDVTESNVEVRLTYYISDYGSQYGIGNEVISRVMATLKQNNIPFAKPKMEIVQGAQP